MNLNHNPYHSNRSPILGTRGAVATSQPLAAQAGLEMLKAGGNAVDAAIATAVALTVLEPTSNGIGGDAFALVWDGDKLHGLNASGRAPAKTTLELFSAQGLSDVPRLGWLPVTVPGAPSAWRDLHTRFGQLEFEQLFEPAIHYAQNGYPVSPTLAHNWQRAAQVYSRLKTPEFLPWLQTFTSNGRAPKAGEVFALPDHAKTLAAIAATRAAAFYEGELSFRIEDFAEQTGGLISRADLKAHVANWVEPISTNYRGYDVWEIPPNTQGIASLAALNILEGFELSRHARDSVESYHLQIEAMKLAFMDARAFVADPNHSDVPVTGMLDKHYAAQRRKLILETALEPSPGTPSRGGTVYLCTADQDGMMVSYIQSNYAGFGSGIVIPGTGIALQNRGANFNLEPNHPNRIAPGKRPYHTIIPGFFKQRPAGHRTVWRHGWLHAAPRSFANDDQHHRLRPQPASQSGCSTVAMVGRQADRTRASDPRPHCRGFERTWTSGQHATRERFLWTRADHLAFERCVGGRLRLENRWAGVGVLSILDEIISCPQGKNVTAMHCCCLLAFLPMLFLWWSVQGSNLRPTD